MAKLTNLFEQTKLTTSSTDKHYLLDAEDDFSSGFLNASHQQQFSSELHAPGRSRHTNYRTLCHRNRSAINRDNHSGLPLRRRAVFLIITRDSRPNRFPLLPITIADLHVVVI